MVFQSIFYTIFGNGFILHFRHVSTEKFLSNSINAIPNKDDETLMLSSNVNVYNCTFVSKASMILQIHTTHKLLTVCVGHSQLIFVIDNIHQISFHFNHSVSTFWLMTFFLCYKAHSPIHFMCGKFSNSFFCITFCIGRIYIWSVRNITV